VRYRVNMGRVERCAFCPRWASGRWAVTAEDRDGKRRREIQPKHPSRSAYPLRRRQSPDRPFVPALLLSAQTTHPPAPAIRLSVAPQAIR
jgi:hypothetical protein